MTIGYKKISQMIQKEVDAIEGLNDKQRRKLAGLCDKIYMIEASSTATSAVKMRDELMQEISRSAFLMQEDDA
tara:strand:- start:135 stop:353 length:219 start_codon:yes stop_codon:yes gene_type:complete